MSRTHRTKEQGDLGVLKAQVDLFEQGFTILLPQTERSPFDLEPTEIVNSVGSRLSIEPSIDSEK